MMADTQISETMFDEFDGGDSEVSETMFDEFDGGDGPQFVPGPPQTKWEEVPVGKEGITTKWIERDMSRQDIADWYQLGEGTGGDFPSRLAGSAGTLEDARRNLASQFKIPVADMKVWNTDAGLMFINPDTDKRELLDPAGLDIGDIKMAGPEAAIIGAEVLAAGTTAAATKSPLLAAGAGAGAATLARGALLGGAELAGIVEDPDYLGEMGTEAGISLLGGAAPSVARGVRQAFSPERRAAETLARKSPRAPGVPPQRTESRLAEDIEAGESLLQPVTERTGAQFTTGQMVSEVSPEMGARIVASERTAMDPVGADFMARGQREAGAKLTKEIAPQRIVDAEAAGQAIKEVATLRVDEAVDGIRASTRAHMDTFNADLAGMAGKDPTSAGSLIRDNLETARDDIFKIMSNGYDKALEALPPGFRVDMSPLVETAQKWKRSLGDDIFKSLASEDRKLVQDALELGEDRASVMKSMSSAQRAITVLKRHHRRVKNQSTKTGIEDIKMIEDMIGGLEKSRNRAIRTSGVGGPAIADELARLDTAWAKGKKQIDEGLVGDLLSRKRGDLYTVADDAVLRNIIRSESNFNTFMNLANDYPALNAVDDLRQAMRGLYTDQVVDGTVKHSTWVNRNRKTIDRLFGAEAKVFDNAAKTQQAMLDAAANEKKLIGELSTRFDYKFSSFTPEAAVRTVAGVPSQARQMKAMLRDYPEKWKAYTDVRRQDIVDTLMRDDEASFGALETMLKGDGRKELEITFGKDYVDTLGLLKTLTAAQRRKAGQRLQTGAIGDVNTAVGTIRRMVFGPLDPTSFRARTVGRLSAHQSDLAMERLLNDPKLLKQAINARNQSLGSKAWANVYAQLGLSAYHDEASTAEKEPVQ